MAVMRSGVLVWRGRGRERREGRGEEYKTCLGVYPYRMFVLRWPWLAKLGTRHPSPLPPPRGWKAPTKYGVYVILTNRSSTFTTGKEWQVLVCCETLPSRFGNELRIA